MVTHYVMEDGEELVTVKYAPSRWAVFSIKHNIYTLINICQNQKQLEGCLKRMLPPFNRRSSNRFYGDSS